MWHPTKLRDFFQNFDPKNPNHLAAVDKLQDTVADRMNDEEEWVWLFRGFTHKLAIDLIEKYEGFRPRPYICPAGIPTIGYGQTYYPSTGKQVSMGDPLLSKQEAKALLMETITTKILPKLEATIPYWNEMTSGQQSVLISFAFNLGENFYGDDTRFQSITRNLKEKRWDLVPKTLLKYINPGSPYELGLSRRRKEEGDLWTKHSEKP